MNERLWFVFVQVVRLEAEARSTLGGGMWLKNSLGEFRGWQMAREGLVNCRKSRGMWRGGVTGCGVWSLVTGSSRGGLLARTQKCVDRLFLQSYHAEGVLQAMTCYFDTVA